MVEAKEEGGTVVAHGGRVVCVRLELVAVCRLVWLCVALCSCVWFCVALCGFV